MNISIYKSIEKANLSKDSDAKLRIETASRRTTAEPPQPNTATAVPGRFGYRDCFFLDRPFLCIDLWNRRHQCRQKAKPYQQ